MLPTVINGGGSSTGTTRTPASIIAQTAAKYGIPSWIPLDIAQRESSMNPNSWAKDSNGYYSGGLFQLNQAGLGAGMTRAQITDPQTNATIAISHMTNAYQAGISRGLSGVNLLDYTANNSGWPGSMGVEWTQANEPSYDSVLNKIYASNGGSSATAANFTGGDGGTDGNTGSSATLSGLSSNSSAIVRFCQNLDSLMTINNTPTVTDPFGWIVKDARAVGFHLFFFLLGLGLILMGLMSMIKDTGVLQAAANVAKVVK